MKPLRIIVCGARGKMGRRIVALARRSPLFEVVGEIGKEESSGLKDHVSLGDVLIEFTDPAATLEHLSVCVKHKKPAVIGTTGFSPSQSARIRKASRKIPVFLSPNMSPGMNLLFELARLAAQNLPDYDPAIVETHHNQKKDAPSGTALRLKEKTGKEVPIVSVRAGDIVGEHSFILAGPGERLELTHRAHSRDVFAEGALKAARWLAQRTKPGLYDFTHLLSFH